MKTIYTLSLFIFTAFHIMATPLPEQATDKQAITQTARNYLVSQHIGAKTLMKQALHPKLAKRTYWRSGENNEFIMETGVDTMLNVAENYNKQGDKFPERPRIEITILDIDQRIASVKLSADDWIDYMHLVKTEHGQWKILNVLWQYHDINKHQ